MRDSIGVKHICRCGFCKMNWSVVIIDLSCSRAVLRRGVPGACSIRAVGGEVIEWSAEEVERSMTCIDG
jgi:hypothetical protein